MRLHSLKLHNFKNYNTRSFELHPRLNLILGNNGTGKTNFLDAIYYVAFGRSFYHIPDRKLIRFDSREEPDPFFRIEGRTADENDYVFAYSHQRKKLASKNKAPYERISDHIGEIPLVSVFPEDLDILKQDSSYRRRFTDSTLGQTQAPYLRALMTYNRILRQKNELLKNFSMRPADKSLLLDKYDADLVPLIEKISQDRLDFIQRFNPVYQEFYSDIAPVRGEASRIEYDSSIEPGNAAEGLKEARRRDWEKGRSTRGPHRDDFKIMLKDQPAKYFASQGQQKSILFSLKLAQYRYIRDSLGKKPILLLDDFFEKLDHLRIRNLMEILGREGIGQLFITDTDRERMVKIAEESGFTYSIFSITNENHE